MAAACKYVVRQSGIYGYGVKPAHLIRRSRAFASSPASLGIKSFIHGYGIPQAQVTRRSYAFASSPASLDIKSSIHGYGIPHAQFIRRYYGFSSRPASLAKSSSGPLPHSMQPHMLSQSLKYSSKPMKEFCQAKMLNLRSFVTSKWAQLPKRTRRQLEVAAISSAVGLIETLANNLWKVVVGALTGVAATEASREKETDPAETEVTKAEVDNVRRGNMADKVVDKVCAEIAKLLSAASKVAESMKADAECMKAEAERMKAEAERMKAEAERIKAEAEGIKAEAEGIKAEAERIKADAERIKVEAERIKAEAKRMKAEAKKMQSYAEKMLSEIELMKIWTTSWWSAPGSRKD